MTRTAHVTEVARPPADIVEAFETALLGTGRSRVEHQQLWALWNESDKSWAGSWAARPRLADALETLAASGIIELPATGGRLWDPAAPSLPLRIAVPANRHPAVAALDPATEPWSPAMDWAPAWIRASRPPQRLRLAAAQINRWLLAMTGKQPPGVAREERSLHVFEDEKRLASLSGTALFSSDRLTLAALSCDAPIGALRVARLRPEGRILVVENKSTFDSAWRAQHATDEPGYAAIVFGAGDAAASLLNDFRHLPAMLDITPTAFDYAGDVDIAGVEAAAAFAATLKSAGLEVTMASSLWDAVALADPTGEDITAERDRTACAVESAHSLGLPAAVTARLNEGLRVPQERIDRNALADTTWWQTAT